MPRVLTYWLKRHPSTLPAICSTCSYLAPDNHLGQLCLSYFRSPRLIWQRPSTCVATSPSDDLYDVFHIPKRMAYSHYGTETRRFLDPDKTVNQVA